MFCAVLAILCSATMVDRSVYAQVAQAQYQWRKYSKCMGFLVLVYLNK